jgi:hypothetical protein
MPLLRECARALCACGTAGRGQCAAADPGGRAQGPGGLNSTEVREWARAQGIGVKDRGWVPAEVVVTFKTAAAG